ncbi:MAG TPA: hypothetical protein VI893_06155, partial [Thermoplasmata archaeon]|nr:hypothetical protein [Thermoplasmata archaeon]
SALMSDAPAAAPYYTASIIYVTGFVGYLQELVRFQMNLYVVTIIFGYVGGAVAEMRLADYASGSSASDSNSSSNSNVVVNVHGTGGRGADEEDDGSLAPRSSNRSSDDALPSYSSSRSLPPATAAALALRGPNWRRRRLRGEPKAEREAKSMAGRARAQRADGGEDETGPTEETVNDSYFRMEPGRREGLAPGSSLAARRREGRQSETGEEDAESLIPKEYIRSHTRAQEPAQRSREIERPSRDRVKQLEDEGEELESKRALGHRPAHGHESPAHHASHTPEPKALPARAVRRVPKLERGDDEERSHSSGQSVHNLHRAAPRLSAAEHAARLVKEKRIHHSAKGEGGDDDEEEEKGRGHGDATEGDDVPEKRQDEIQKLVQRALHGTGPANFQVKKEAEHNWEVL